MIEARDPTKGYGGTLAADGLFVSTLQRSDVPGADMVAKAITATMRKFGAEGCTSRMAQEFGDHPEAAAARMRWVQSLLS